MSGSSFQSPEDDALAAEFALRLLDEAELDRARAREAADPAFAAAVGAWNARLMPLLDAIAPVDPDAALWPRIVAAIDPRSSVSNVVPIRRKLFHWRDAAFALTGIAAALLLSVGLRKPEEPAPPTAARASEVAVAAVIPEDGGAALAVVSYDRVGASLIVTPAALEPVSGRSHELWVVPASGAARSLGLLEGPGPRRIVLAEDMAASFAGTPTIAISAERSGGSRTGAPAGPVVASGKLIRV